MVTKGKSKENFKCGNTRMLRNEELKELFRRYGGER
jgi:hypothetical protein